MAGALIGAFGATRDTREGRETEKYVLMTTCGREKRNKCGSNKISPESYRSAERLQTRFE